MKSLLLKIMWICCAGVITAACDSPMNHRLRGEDKAQMTAQKVSLPQIDLQVVALWLHEPSGNVQEQNSLLVILKDSDGKLIHLPANYTLVFYATMPSMGHPLDSPGEFEMLKEGIYLNPQIRYNMNGEWQNELWIIDENLQLVDKIVWTEFL